MDADRESPGQGGSAGSERRLDRRLDDRCRVSFKALRGKAAGPRTEAAETINLSPSGICMASPIALLPGDDLALEIHLDGNDEPVVAMGRVVWCDSRGPYWRTGIAFSWLRSEDRTPLEALKRWLSERADS